jgi:hypothetical protein
LWFEASLGKQFLKPYLKKSAGGVVQGEGPEFKPQYHRKKKHNRNEATKLDEEKHREVVN